MQSNADRIDILHDHYKESFALIREREKLRDRMFLILIGLYALLILTIGYPAQFTGSLGTVSFLGGQLDLDALPLAGLLSALWVFTFSVALRYCQLSITVERSYDYLHRLEETISPLLGDSPIYRREGEFYLNSYPPLLNLAWIAYGYVFPAIIGIATGTLLIAEWRKLDYALPHKLLDTFVGAGILITLVCYRLVPTLLRQKDCPMPWWSSRRKRRT